MNDIQQAFLNMLLKVQDNLEDNAAAYATHLQIAPTKVLLDAQIQNIIEAAGRATEDTTGVAQDKQQDRDALVKVMYNIAKGVYSFAIDNNNNTLAKKVKYTMSDLEKMQDTQLHFEALRLNTYLTPAIVAALPGYNVSAADIADLPVLTASYFAAIPEVKDAIEGKTIGGNDVDRGIAESRKLLEKLDNYIDSYRTNAATVALWEEYQLARAIDNPTGGGGGGGGSEVVFSGTVPPMSSEVKGPVVYNAATPVALQNNSSVTLGFQLQMSGISSGMIVNVPPMSTQNTTLGAMGANGNEIRINNSDMMQSAAYTITLG